MIRQPCRKYFRELGILVRYLYSREVVARIAFVLEIVAALSGLFIHSVRSPRKGVRSQTTTASLAVTNNGGRFDR